MVGQSMSLSRILERLEIHDPAQMEHLKNMVRQHWKRDSRCPKNFAEGQCRFKISTSPLAIELARELVDTLEYRLHFEDKCGEEVISLLADLYRTQWRYNKDNSLRTTTLAPFTRVRKKTKAKKSKSSFAKYNKKTQIVKQSESSSSLPPQGHHRNSSQITSNTQDLRSPLDDLLSEGIEIFGGDYASPTSHGSPEASHPPDRVFDKRVDSIFDEINGTESQSGISATEVLENEHRPSTHDTNDHASPASSPVWSTDSADEESDRSSYTKLNRIMQSYERESLSRAVLIFSEYLDRVRDEGATSVAQVTRTFQEIFEAYAIDVFEAEKVYGDGFVDV